MKVAVGRCPESGAALASQSTISRLGNAPIEDPDEFGLIHERHAEHRTSVLLSNTRIRRKGIRDGRIIQYHALSILHDVP
jgi:hypothetical protein